MSIKDKLQIILITYNRKNFLQRTFNQIFDEKSPIKDFEITILDNCSTDGTSELIDEYCRKFPNIEHIKHPINIGGNANICRAFELAYVKNKEYFWILCDDDFFDFDGWKQIEDIVETKNKDLILLSHVLPADSITPEIVPNELAFLPAGIYKTSLITSSFIQNAYINIYHLYPHLALICNMLNNNDNILNMTILNKQIVKQNNKRADVDFSRGLDKKNIHEKNKNVDLFLSYVNTYKMINDKNFRYKCCKHLYLGKPFYYSAYKFLENNKKHLFNLIDFFMCISFKQKLIFLLTPIICFFEKIGSIFKFCRFYSTILISNSRIGR